MKLFRLLFAVFGASLVFSGCASSPVDAVAPERARVTVDNQTGYTWRIVMRSSAGDEAFASRVPPRAAVTIDVDGGDYTIEQTILLAGSSEGASRTLAMRLEKGQAYHWPLATLLSEPVGAEPMARAKREPGT